MKKYLDPSAQKAYMQGINGCVEHVQVVSEVIQHAKTYSKTAHISWVDFEDAFGSIPHMLIPIVLKHYNLPEIITKYITDIYSKLLGRVGWETEVFEFLKVVFQGDPYSGTIFLIVFNPLIEYIKESKDKQGYLITDNIEKDAEKDKKGKISVITTPFADDFNIISRNQKQHQQLFTDIENNGINI